MSRFIDKENITRCVELEYLWKLLHEWRLDETDRNEGVSLYDLSVALSQTPLAGTYFVDALDDLIRTVEGDTDPYYMETFDIDSVDIYMDKIKEKCYE